MRNTQAFQASVVRHVSNQQELITALTDAIRFSSSYTPMRILLQQTIILDKTIVISSDIPNLIIDGQYGRIFVAHTSSVFDVRCPILRFDSLVIRSSTEGDVNTFLLGDGAGNVTVSNCDVLCETVCSGDFQSLKIRDTLLDSQNTGKSVFDGDVTDFALSGVSGSFDCVDGFIKDFNVYNGLDCFDLVEDFSNGRLTGPFDLAWTSVASSGSAAAIQVAGRLGVLQQTVSGVQQRAHRIGLGGTGTTASGMFLQAGITYVIEVEFMLSQKPTATQDFTFQAGLGNNISIIVNQVYVDVRFSSSANNITFRCANAGVTTILDSAVDINPTVWHKAKLVVVGLTKVLCYLNGSYVGQITTDLPVGSLAPLFNLVSAAGAGNKVATIDKIKYRVVRRKL